MRLRHTIDTEALIGRQSVDEQDRLCLPDGLTYRYSLFKQTDRWHPPARTFGREADDPLGPAPESNSGRPLDLSSTGLRNLKQLVEAGATLIGPEKQSLAVETFGYFHSLRTEQQPSASAARSGAASTHCITTRQERQIPRSRRVSSVLTFEMRFRGSEASNAVIAQGFEDRVPRNEPFLNGPGTAGLYSSRI